MFVTIARVVPARPFVLHAKSQLQRYYQSTTGYQSIQLVSRIPKTAAQCQVHTQTLPDL
jgi:hypothetical protein